MTYSKSHRPKPKPILGYTTRRHLLLDLDNTTLTKATKLAKLLTRQYPKLGDCLICESSNTPLKELRRYTRRGRIILYRTLPSYHLIFNNQIGYNSCCHIIKTLARLQILDRDYYKIRMFRGDMTLRISPCINTDKVKPVPIPKTLIFSKPNIRQDDMIWRYLEILEISVKMNLNYQPLFSAVSEYQTPRQ